jgi:hypothetical protein
MEFLLYLFPVTHLDLNAVVVADAHAIDLIPDTLRIMNPEDLTVCGLPGAGLQGKSQKKAMRGKMYCTSGIKL